MENELRTLNIACLNPDSMGEATMQQEIVKCLARNQTHIAATQETHILQDRRYLLGNYGIITSSADISEGKGGVSGGTAITIHESMQQHTPQITRQSSRVLRVTMGHSASKMPIRIISTYAPRNGHIEEERSRRWKDVKEY